MIVSHKFVWAHLPKTGGDATATMIQQVPRLIVLSDDLRDHAKHLSLDHRMGSAEGKLLVANIRRLPDWAFSFMRHRQRFGLWPDYQPEGPRPADVVAAESAADDWLEEIVGDHHIDRWLRQEFLVDDLVGFLRDIADLTDDEEHAIRAVGRVNEGPRGSWLSRRRAKRFFSESQIQTLYRSNPRWAAIERQAYASAKPATHVDQRREGTVSK